MIDVFRISSKSSDSSDSSKPSDSSESSESSESSDQVRLAHLWVDFRVIYSMTTFGGDFLFNLVAPLP